MYSVLSIMQYDAIRIEMYNVSDEFLRARKQEIIRKDVESDKRLEEFETGVSEGTLDPDFMGQMIDFFASMTDAKEIIEYILNTYNPNGFDHSVPGDGDTALYFYIFTW